MSAEFGYKEFLNAVFFDCLPEDADDALLFSCDDNERTAQTPEEISTLLEESLDAWVSMATMSDNIVGFGGFDCAEASTSFPEPSLILGQGPRVFNIWLLDGPVHGSDAERVDALKACVRGVYPQARLDDFVPIAGQNGWERIGGCGEAYGFEVLVPGSNPSETRQNSQILDLQVTVGASLKGVKTPPGTWRNMTRTVRDLVVMLGEHEQGGKDGKCILQGEVIAGERKAQAMRANYLLMLDLDTGDDMEAVVARIRELGLFAIVWTTWSHLKPSTDVRKDAVLKFIGADREPTAEEVFGYLKKEKLYRPWVLENAKVRGTTHTKDGVMITVDHAPMPKFRVLFVLDRPFVFAEVATNPRKGVELWKRRYAGVSKLIGAAYDRSCTDPSRLMYTPRHPQDGKGYEVRVIDGEPLSLDNIPDPEDEKSVFERVSEALDGPSGGGKELRNPWIMRFLAEKAEAFDAESFFRDYGEDRGARNGAGGHFKCPNDAAHTNADDPEDKGFFVVSAGDADFTDGFVAKCMHASCADLDRADFLDLVVSENNLSEEDLNPYLIEIEVERTEGEAAIIAAAKTQTSDDEEGGEDEDVSDAVYDDPYIRKHMEAMNEKFAIVLLGSDARILRVPQTLIQSPKFQGVDGWKTMESNKKLLVPADKGFKQERATKLWMEWPERRTYENGIAFEPDVSKLPDGTYNLWRGFPYKGKHGDWGLLHNHVLDNVCQGNDLHYRWLMTWLAQLFQFPGEKLGSSIAIRGLKGTGKSKLLDWVRKSLGPYAIKVAQKHHITGNFNGHQRGIILMVCEEAFWAGDHQAGNALKDLITSDEMMFEQKGVDAVPTSNYCRLGFISNESWVVPAGLEDERRYFVIECGDARRGDIKFFAAIDKQMHNGGREAMIHQLMNWDPIVDGGFKEGWDILRLPPMTDQLVSQAMESLEPWDKFFINMIEDGGCEPKDNPSLEGIYLDGEFAETRDSPLGQRVFIRAAVLEGHYDNHLKTIGGAARHKIGNRKFLKKLVQRYLSADHGGETVNRRIQGKQVRCYEVPTLEEIRTHARERRKLDIHVPRPLSDDED